LGLLDPKAYRVYKALLVILARLDLRVRLALVDRQDLLARKVRHLPWLDLQDQRARPLLSRGLLVLKVYKEFKVYKV
jgi:hypothetical protein